MAKREYEAWNNERLDEILADPSIDRHLKRLSEVTGWNKKVLIRCEDCGYEWETIPHTLKQGVGCPKCANRKKLGGTRKAKYTYKEVKEIVEDHGFTLVSDTYDTSTTPLEMKCPICGSVFKKTLSSLLRGFDTCPVCRGTGEIKKGH